MLRLNQVLALSLLEVMGGSIYRGLGLDLAFGLGQLKDLGLDLLACLFLGLATGCGVEIDEDNEKNKCLCKV